MCCVCVRACIHACVCMHTCMHACVCVCACVHVRTHVCVYVCAIFCHCVSLSMHIHTATNALTLFIPPLVNQPHAIWITCAYLRSAVMKRNVPEGGEVEGACVLTHTIICNWIYFVSVYTRTSAVKISV